MPNQKKFLSGGNLVKYDEIIKDWVDDKTVELTQAEYDALTPAEKMNGTTYYITDGQGGGGGASSADDVSYDNISSGLTATNVQDAVDELSTDKANGAGLTFSVDQDGILCVTY